MVDAGAPRIVLVDDDHVFASVVTERLADEGVRVIAHATNGFEAIEWAIRLKPDAIAMDIEMPLMDGIEATRRLALLGITVILVTGGESSRRVSEGIEAGAVAWVRKSDGIGVLATLLRAATHERGH